MSVSKVPYADARRYLVKTHLSHGGVLISQPFSSLSAALAWAQFAERHGVAVEKITIEIQRPAADPAAS
jgi:hypothetical protein